MARPWLRRLKKIAGYGFLGLVALAAIVITFTVGWRPFIGPEARALTDRTFASTPERLERGKYLAEGVTRCLGCHSKGNSKGSGRVRFEGKNYRIVAPNITPDLETGIGGLSDDMLARAIREGIGRDGNALQRNMPYWDYKYMSDEDVASIVVYLRSLEPVRNELPETFLPFRHSRLLNLIPESIITPVADPDTSDLVAYGKYLVHLGTCEQCHTPQAGLEFSGGPMRGGGKQRVAATNLTPDPTGIPYYDEELFVEVMRTGSVKARKLMPSMPFSLYRNMTDRDLSAIFAYLRTLKAVKHSVDNSEPPTKCKLCGIKHGGGERN